VELWANLTFKNMRSITINYALNQLLQLKEQLGGETEIQVFKEGSRAEEPETFPIFEISVRDSRPTIEI
jgi:hypothetical protein